MSLLQYQGVIFLMTSFTRYRYLSFLYLSLIDFNKDKAAILFDAAYCDTSNHFQTALDVVIIMISCIGYIYF